MSPRNRSFLLSLPYSDICGEKPMREVALSQKPWIPKCSSWGLQPILFPGIEALPDVFSGYHTHFMDKE